MSNQFNRLTTVLARSFKLDEDQIVSSFRLANLDEVSKVSSLRRQVFGAEIKEDDEIYLKWRYFNREKYPSTLWVFEYNKQVIAALGTEPVQLWKNGEYHAALRNMDAIVEPRFNSRGLGAWMTLALQNQNNYVLVTGGNENSASMLNKLFTRLPVKKNFKIILHSYHFLRNKISNDYIARIISPVVDLTLYLFLNLKWLLISGPNRWKIKHYKDIHLLLPNITDQKGLLGKVKVVRTRDYLKWRYVTNPCIQFYAVGLFNDDVLKGYVIYTYSKAEDSRAVSSAYIMDWDIFSKPEKIRTLSSLFKALIKELKNRGMDEINIVLNDSDSSQAAKKSGFIFRYTDPNFFVFGKNLPEDDLIFSSDAWYHSLGDSDTI